MPEVVGVKVYGKRMGVVRARAFGGSYERNNAWQEHRLLVEPDKIEAPKTLRSPYSGVYYRS